MGRYCPICYQAIPIIGNDNNGEDVVCQCYKILRIDLSNIHGKLMRHLPVMRYPYAGLGDKYSPTAYGTFRFADYPNQYEVEPEVFKSLYPNVQKAILKIRDVLNRFESKIEASNG